MFKLKRMAFTLAEVLIALGLVGILSAVAIQTMKQNDHAAEFEALKNKSVMNVQASMHDAMYKVKAGEIITEGDPLIDASIDSLKTKVEDALVTKGEKPFPNAYIFDPDPDTVWEFKGMRDGVYFAIDTDKTKLTETSAVARVAIDVNAEAGPNNNGKDQLLLYMDKYGNLGPVLPPKTGCEEPEVWVAVCGACKNPADCTSPRSWVREGSTCECKCPLDKPYFYDGDCHECPEDNPHCCGENEEWVSENCGCKTLCPDGYKRNSQTCGCDPVIPAFDCKKAGGVQYTIAGVVYCLCKGKCEEHEYLDDALNVCKLDSPGAIGLLSAEKDYAWHNGANFNISCRENGQYDSAAGCVHEAVAGVPGAIWERIQYVSPLREYHEYIQTSRFSRHIIGLACAYRKNASYTNSNFATQCVTDYAELKGYSDLGDPYWSPGAYIDEMGRLLLKDVDDLVTNINIKRINEYQAKVMSECTVGQLCCPDQVRDDDIPNEPDIADPDLYSEQETLYLYASVRHAPAGVMQNRYELKVWVSDGKDGMGVYPETFYNAKIVCAIGDSGDIITLTSLYNGQNTTYFNVGSGKYAGVTPDNVGGKLKIKSAMIDSKKYKLEIRY